MLLLYQHARFPRLNTEVQQFGLHGDIGSELQSYTVLEGRRIVATGSRWLGVIGDWEFNRDHIREFRADPRFAYLDDALRTTPGRRTDLQRRAISAVRNRAWYVDTRRAYTPPPTPKVDQKAAIQDASL
ncbi:MAG: hypothetical protein M3067_00530 [Chloroflexota bacterium]|nr:hypothetical protein [Chloroflexota bacterium]